MGSVRSRLELIALDSFPLVSPGDDLCKLILGSLGQNNLDLQSGDILVLAQKIVSKAEDRYVRLADITPSAEAIELAQQAHKDPRQTELILRESSAVLRVRPGVVIVEHQNGYVHANAGMDSPIYPTISTIPRFCSCLRTLTLPRGSCAMTFMRLPA